MDASNFLTDFYAGHDEDARLRSRHGMVEFLTTMRYVEKYWKPGDRILEIGAGTGRYSHALARKGRAVDAVELLEDHIEVFRQNTLPGEPVSIRQGNDATVLQCCFGREFLKNPRYRALTDMDTFRLSSTPEEIFALHRKEDIDALMDGLPAERLHFVGTDMATGYMADAVEQMDDELYELYLRYHFAVCERPDLVGASNHFLDVARKK